MHQLVYKIVLIAIFLKCKYRCLSFIQANYKYTQCVYVCVGGMEGWKEGERCKLQHPVLPWHNLVFYCLKWRGK